MPGPYFYPRSPCGERLTTETHTTAASKFLSTLSLRRATLADCTKIYAVGDFYPRSPCGERPKWGCRYRRCRTISIHALLAESDGILGRRVRYRQQFLSTLSLRRATRQQNRPLRHFGFLSTLSLRRATCQLMVRSFMRRDFYPRSPCGERPHIRSTSPDRPGISIHALLAESDQRFGQIAADLLNFYPRSPCGERPSMYMYGILYL